MAASDRVGNRGCSIFGCLSVTPLVGNCPRARRTPWWHLV